MDSKIIAEDWGIHFYIKVILREKLKGKAKVSSKIELIGLKKEKIN